MRFWLLFFVIAMLLCLLKRHHRRCLGMLRSQAKARPSDTAQHMVQCRYCGVYLPQSEALQGETGFFCNKNHQADSEKSKHHSQGS